MRSGAAPEENLRDIILQMVLLHPQGAHLLSNVDRVPNLGMRRENGLERGVVATPPDTW